MIQKLFKNKTVEIRKQNIEAISERCRIFKSKTLEFMLEEDFIPREVLNTLTFHGDSLGHLSIKHKNFKLLKLLIQKGMRINLKNKSGLTVRDWIYNKKIQII